MKSFPDNYPKIQFETGEIAWIKNRISINKRWLLELIFQDLTWGVRYEDNLPKYNKL